MKIFLIVAILILLPLYTSSNFDIKEEELIDGVEKGGVAMYLARAETADTNLFI